MRLGVMTVWTMVQTIVSLNAILLLGALEQDSPLHHWILHSLVPLVDVSLLVSSGFLAIYFGKLRQRRLAGLFALNIIVVLVAGVIRISGFEFPRWLLFGADLYWLNLYLICLVGNFARPDQAPPESASVPR